MPKKYITKDDHYYNRQQFMTDDDIKMVDDYLTKINMNQGEMIELYSKWEKIETAYKGEQALKSNMPNTRVNILNANIEGQVANIIEQNLAISTRGESPGDKNYAEFAKIGLDWTLRKNYIKKVIDQHERRRLKFGTGIFKVSFDPDAIYGYGLVRITSIPLNKIFIDAKIKDPLKLQDAEYIAESLRISKTMAIEVFGEEKAKTIQYGSFGIYDATIFEEYNSDDDEEGATIFELYTRHKGVLRCVIFSACGLLLYDSHREGTKKDNQKTAKFNHVSYFNYVNDKFPYFLTTLYPVEGTLWGFGDGELLVKLNDLLNDLYDKIRIVARPNLILFDPDSEVDLEDFDENSFDPRPARLSTNKAVDVVSWGTVNDSWWRLLQQVHQEIQRVTRFSDLMMGQGSSSANTATEATIQQQQGNNSTNHKKQMLEVTLTEMCEYILGIMMDSYTEGKAFRLAEDKDEHVWIDFRDLTRVPAMKPATLEYKKEYMKSLKEKGIEGEYPEWEIIVNEKTGEPITKNVDLDIEISIGAGLPKNKAFLWQMVEKLSQMFSIDAQGMKRTVVTYEELRDFIKNFIGIPLEDEQVNNILQQPAPNIPGQQQTPQSPDAMGLSMGGNPMLGGGMRG